MRISICLVVTFVAKVFAIRQSITTDNEQLQLFERQLRVMKRTNEPVVPGPLGCPATIPKNVGELKHNRKANKKTTGVGKELTKHHPGKKGETDDDDGDYHGKKGKKEELRQLFQNDKKNNNHNSCQFDSIVVLGDSLSDIGNLFFSPVCNTTATGIYCVSRNSNGALLAEYMAAALNVGPLTVGAMPGGNNFAVGGSTSKDVLGQVLLYGVATGLFPPTAESNSIPIVPASLDPPDAHRIHTITVGGNDVLQALLSRLGTFLGIKSIETSVTPEQALQAATEYFAQIVSTLFSMPGVCNVVAFSPADASFSPLYQETDRFFSSLNFPGTAQKMREYGLLLIELFQGVVEDIQPSFDAKCRRLNADFGIAFFNSETISADFSPERMFRIRNTTCNQERIIVSEKQCLSTAAPLVVPGFPLVPLSTDGSRVWCRVPVVPVKDCQCKGVELFDGQHPTTAYHAAFAHVTLEKLDGVCRRFHAP